jgi:hypothetical protein
VKVVTNREQDLIMGHIFFVPQQVNNLDFAIPSQAQGLTSQILDTQIPTNMLEDKWPTPVKIQVLQDYLLGYNVECIWTVKLLVGYVPLIAHQYDKIIKSVVIC